MWWGNVGRSPQNVQVVLSVICGARKAGPSLSSNRRPENVHDFSTLCSLRKLMMGNTSPRISYNIHCNIYV